MEPGLRDREYKPGQASPDLGCHAAMEPGLRDREYDDRSGVGGRLGDAAMEPGLRDREYSLCDRNHFGVSWLQWSPVLETGNTS